MSREQEQRPQPTRVQRPARRVSRGERRSGGEDTPREENGNRPVGKGWGCLLPLLVLLVAAGVGAFIIVTAEDPEPEEREERVAVVRTTTADQSLHRLNVHGRGQVRPAQQVLLFPQVQGRIAEVNPRLEPGSRLSAGEVMVRIEPDDYELALQEAESVLTDARAELALEEGRQEVAEEEWELFRDDLDEMDPEDRSSLALREPQLEVARGRVQAAEAQLARARLDLQRTEIRAPFDAIVLRETASLGQLVGPQNEIAELIGSEVLWVEASVRLEQIDFIAIPGLNAEEGSRVSVRQDLGAQQVEWIGRVVRLLGELAPEGLMARVLVEVRDPFDDSSGEDLSRRAPLLINASVAVEFEGRRAEELVEVPRAALREGGRVFVADERNRLSIRQPEIVWRLPETVLVRSGVAEGERLIVSPIATPVEGLRVVEDEGERE